MTVITEAKLVFGLQPMELIKINKELKKWDSEPSFINESAKFSKSFWEFMGTKLNWCPHTLSLHYFKIRDIK